MRSDRLVRVGWGEAVGNQIDVTVFYRDCRFCRGIGGLIGIERMRAGEVRDEWGGGALVGQIC